MSDEEIWGSSAKGREVEEESFFFLNQDQSVTHISVHRQNLYSDRINII